MNALGQCLRERSAQRGLSISELARRAGKSRQTLLSIGTDSGRLPAIETLVNIALALDVHPLRLMQLVFEDLPLPNKQAQSFKKRGDKSLFVADVTIPDGHLVMVGSSFTKTWAVQNMGTVPWVDRSLDCVDEELVVTSKTGEQLVIAQRLQPAVKRIAVPYTAPGGIVEMSVAFKAPPFPGTCVSYWKSHFADGSPCFPTSVGLSCCVHVISARSTGVGGEGRLRAEARSLGRKHGLQSVQRSRQRGWPHSAQALHQAHAVQRAYLVQHNQALLALKSHRNAKPRWPKTRGHGRHGHRAQVCVHVVWRDHQTRAGLLNLAAHRRVQLRQPDVTPLHHQTS